MKQRRQYENHHGVSANRFTPPSWEEEKLAETSGVSCSTVDNRASSWLWLLLVVTLVCFSTGAAQVAAQLYTYSLGGSLLKKRKALKTKRNVNDSAKSKPLIASLGGMKAV
jgi:hypothetical protein